MTATQAPKPTKPQNNKTLAARAGQAKNDGLFDHALEDLPPELRWRDFMCRIEVVLFASSVPVSRETLARVVGSECSIDLLIDDLIEALNDRPYTVVAVAGGWQLRTRPLYASTIRAAWSCPDKMEGFSVNIIGNRRTR